MGRVSYPERFLLWYRFGFNLCGWQDIRKELGTLRKAACTALLNFFGRHQTSNKFDFLGQRAEFILFWNSQFLVTSSGIECEHVWAIHTLGNSDSEAAAQIHALFPIKQPQSLSLSLFVCSLGHFTPSITALPHGGWMAESRVDGTYSVHYFGMSA